MLAALLLMGGPLFFAEAQPGVEVGEEPATGAAFAVETGMGGQWNGSLPRFFLVARYERAEIDHTTRRRYDDIAAGLRILIPVVEPVRVYGDALLGATAAHAELDRMSLPELTSDRWRPAVQLAAGIQLRLLENFSVGLRIQQTFHDDSPDALAIAAGEQLEPTRTTFALTVGAHF